MRKLILSSVAMASMFFGSSAYAVALLVSNGSVSNIGNTDSNTPSFSVLVTGGTTNVCQGAWIRFPLDGADPDKLKRAYAAALTAFSTGAKVTIYTYLNVVDCRNAGYIELSK